MLSRIKSRIAVTGALAALGGTSAFSQETLQQIDVTADSVEQTPTFKAPSAIGSRLGLTAQETPASVEVLTQSVLEQRGARSFEEALRGGVGMTSGGAPGSPSVSSSRGFTGGFISYLFDGDRIAVPTMASRPQDTWNYERIEILKGPASVLYGEGAIGAAVNFVTKRPDRANTGAEAMVSYGSFATSRLGVGIGAAVGESSAFRLDYSHAQSDGYVERNRQKTGNLTMGFATALTRDLQLDLSLDYLKDGALSYQGTPLVPRAFAVQPTSIVSDASARVVDRAMAFRNYNVDDAVFASESIWTRAKLTWQLAPQWQLRNAFSYYTANRDWKNAEAYSYASPSRIVRDLVGVSHDHQVWSNRLDLTRTHSIGGMRNRFVAGIEYTKTDFYTERRFSNGSAATNNALAIDVLGTFPGRYGLLSLNSAIYSGAGNRTNFGARIPTTSFFAEDALSLNDRWTLVAGIRQDRIKLNRESLDLHNQAYSAFSQTYRPTSGRLGVVFALNPDTSFYAQYTNASAPVGTSNLLLLSAANSAFSLSTGKQLEVGVKQTLLKGLLDYAIAAYKIELDNILSRDFTDPTLTVNSGSQSSKGLELSAAWRATRDLSISGNLALVEAGFHQLVEAGNASRAGNTPPNVPRKVANLWVDYKVPGWPVRLGAGLNHTGYSFANNANTVRLNGYTTAGAYASWDTARGSLTFRVRNLTDKLYAYWSGASAINQVMVGAPRSFELSYRVAF